MKKVIVIAALLSGCAHNPIIDMQGVDANRYNADLQDCQRYASQVAGVGTGAVAGAIGSALLGFLAAKAGGSRFDAGATARVGAVVGAAGGAAHGAGNETDVVNRCLAGRGYRVLH